MRCPVGKSFYSAMRASMVVLALLALPSFLSAQGKPDWKDRWTKTLAEAKKEGKVVVYAPPGELIRSAFVDGFKKAHPDIEMEFSSARSGEQAVKLQAERDA